MNNVGKIVQIIGPVLDIRFEDGELPNILNAIEIDNKGQRLVAEVAQHIGNHIVRCIMYFDGLDGRTCQRYGRR